jgi:multiple sugar transport system permease protein
MQRVCVRKKKLIKKKSRILRPISKMILAVVYVVPILWIILTSFKSSQDVFTTQASVFFKPTFENYRGLMTKNLLEAVLNSMKIATGCTIITLIVAVPAGFMLARSSRPILIFGLTLLIILQMVPQTASIIPLFQIFHTIGLLDNIFSVILADSALLTPFAILLLRPFFRNIPYVLEEAAQIDGSSRWQIFTKVSLPLARNGIATTATLVFIISWGEFLFAINLILSPNSYPMSAILAQQVGGFGIFWPGLMALSVLASLPIAILFIFTYRLLKDGLTLGAVK